MTEIKAKAIIDTSISADNIKKLTEVISSLIEGIANVDTASKKAEESQTKSAKAAIDETEKVIKENEEAGKKWVFSLLKVDKSYQDLIKRMKESGDAGQLLASAMPQNTSGIIEGVGKVKNSLLSELPFGGLVGLMMYGAMVPEEVRAAGTTVARLFQQAGDVGKKEMSEVGTMIQTIGTRLGKGPTGLANEIAASAAAFGQAGIDIKSVLVDVGGSITGFNEPIMQTAIELDAMFNVGSGASAKLMGEMVQNFNVDLKESRDMVGSLGKAAQDSGTSFTVFVGSVMQSSMALRAQRIDISEVAQAQLNYQKVLERQMGISDKIDKTTGLKDPRTAGAASMAARAIGGITQSISGMSEGMMAVVGERISAKDPGLSGGKAVTGGDAIMLMQGVLTSAEGKMGAKSEKLFVDTIKELKGMAMGAAPDNKFGQMKFLETTMGMSPEAAKATLAMETDMKSSVKLQEEIKKYQESTKTAIDKKSEETSKFQIALMEAQAGLAKLAGGLLGAVIDGFQLIYQGIMYLSEKMTLIGRDEELMGAAMSNMEKLSASVEKHAAQMVSGAKGIGKGGMDALDVAVLQRLTPTKSLEGGGFIDTGAAALGTVFSGGTTDLFEQHEKDLKAADARRKTERKGGGLLETGSALLGTVFSGGLGNLFTDYDEDIKGARARKRTGTQKSPEDADGAEKHIQGHTTVRVQGGTVKFNAEFKPDSVE